MFYWGNILPVSSGKRQALSWHSLKKVDHKGNCPVAKYLCGRADASLYKIVMKTPRLALGTKKMGRSWR